MAPSRYYSNVAVPGTLGASISNSATSLYMSATPSGYPGQFPFTLCLDEGTSSMELVSVTSGAGTAGSPWVVSRGFDGTTAVAHTGGTATITHDLSAYDVATSRSHEASGSGSGVHGLPAAAWETAAYAVINETVLTNSTTGVMTWSDIPATYSHLMVVVMGRCTNTGALINDIQLQINGDSGSYYSYLYMQSNNISGTLAAPAANSSYGEPSLGVFTLASSGGGAAQNAGYGFAILPWYTSTVFNKGILSLTGAGNGTSAMANGRTLWGFYNPPTQAAISSLSLATPTGTYFKSGSSFGLYGLS